MDEYSLDFETTSAIDLRQVGAPRYAADPTTRVLCWSIRHKHSQGRIHRVIPAYSPLTARPRLTIPVPQWAWDAANGKALIHAYNASFEWFILNECCTRLFGWPKIPASAMRCTLARARYWGYSGKLEETSRALGGPQKNMPGHKLMMKMNKPRVRSKKPDAGIADHVWWDLAEPDLMNGLSEYCDDDVIAEEGIAAKLPPLPMSEQIVYELDLRMNARGIRADVGLIEKLRDATTDAVAGLNSDVEKLTGGAVKTTNQVAKLLAFVNGELTTEGQPPAEKLDKEAVSELLARPALPASVRAVVTCRQIAAKSSTAKLQRMLAAASPYDGKLRGLLQYYGAARTGRWAGRIVQPQNLPRGEMKDPIGAADLLSVDMLDAVEVASREGVDVMTMASSMIRACLIPDDFENGGVLLAPDYGQIEARVIAWLAGEKGILEVFARGEDVYTYTAEQIGSDSRQLGKVVVLATGFGMGPPTFVESAAGYGITIDPAEAAKIVYGWRDANPAIVGFWHDLEAAAWRILHGSKSRIPVGDGHVLLEGRPNVVNPANVDLHITLPSSRRLVYPNLRSKAHPAHGRESLCHEGLNPVSGKWGDVFTYSGKLAENVTQAVARDVMALALVHLDQWGAVGTPLLTVHDEAILSVDSTMVLAKVASAVEQIMLFEHPAFTKPMWLKGLPLKVEATAKARYSK